ncbi:hypothetical protein CCR95_20070 [Thiocystis minor]|nr:hypothetical protein [Thiocystis minor]
MGHIGRAIRGFNQLKALTVIDSEPELALNKKNCKIGVDLSDREDYCALQQLLHRTIILLERYR